MNLLYFTNNKFFGKKKSPKVKISYPLCTVAIDRLKQGPENIPYVLKYF